MKMPRMISASTMPTSSALCWSCLGTANLFMMIRKMNRLSTEREYSVSQPAKNSVPYWWPAKTQTPMPNATAIPMKTPSAMLTSLREGSCGRRPMTTMSTSRTALVMPIVSHQVSGDTSMLRASGPVRAHATYDACGCLLSGGLFRRIVATDGPGSGPMSCGQTVMTRPPRRNTPLQRVPSSQTQARPGNRPGGRGATPRARSPRTPRAAPSPRWGRRAPAPRRLPPAPSPR